jgi:anthranilate/para-aminobenzoate synthase component II
MIHIYLPYFVLVLVACLGMGLFGGYLWGRGFRGGAIAETNDFNILLKAEQKKREKIEAKLKIEMLHSKELEDTLEIMTQNDADSVHQTFTEMNEHHNKVLFDPESERSA